MTYNYDSLPDYKYRGARAMVLLHERYLREFMEIWRQAKTINVTLPETEDPDYESLDHILAHVLRAGRGYMTWMCEKLELPDPEIEMPPTASEAEKNADMFLNHLFEKWKTPLAEVEDVKFDGPHKSRWGMDYSIDSMLEHAVMHPIRHSFQLGELMGASTRAELTNYTFRGARAMVLMHERYLREALDMWRQAKAAEVQLAKTSHKAYDSMEDLLRHILGVPKNYMQWMCKNFELPDPMIVYVPDAAHIEAEAERYLSHVIEKWRVPLAGINEEKMSEGFPIWETEIYSGDSMLEHAVLHPIRHTFQLQELMTTR